MHCNDQAVTVSSRLTTRFMDTACSLEQAFADRCSNEDETMNNKYDLICTFCAGGL